MADFQPKCSKCLYFYIRKNDSTFPATCRHSSAIKRHELCLVYNEENRIHRETCHAMRYGNVYDGCGPEGKHFRSRNKSPGAIL